jgi:hypothetical protein
MLRPASWLQGPTDAPTPLLVLAISLAVVTRATLLHVLERPTDLGPAEVRELEQLAQAFPYCQTAHLLLAKAAHDQGTMLAGQRLRRAATYAADRTLLRRLIEQQEPAALPITAAPIAPPHPLDLVDWPDEYVAPTAAPLMPPAPPAAAPLVPAEALPTVIPTAAPAPAAPIPAVSIAEVPAVAAAPLPELVTLTESAALSEPPVTLVAPVALPGVVVPIELPPAEVAVVATSEKAAAPETPATPSGAAAPAEIVLTETPVAVIPAAPTVAAVAAVAATVEENTPVIATAAPGAAADALAPTVEVEAAAASFPAPEIELLAAPVLLTETLPATAVLDILAPELPAAPEVVTVTPVAENLSAPAVEAPETELPPQAPAIRPPVEVGEARFEFGLADPVPVAPAPTYELPGLVDEWAASAVTRSLGNPEALPLTTSVPAVPAFTPAAFTGDAVVGYAFAESSRLGLSMQLLDLLTAKAEAAESATAVVAAAQPPAVPLPPTGTFFEPDPLLLDHWATHRPATPELPSTVDLINNFLKRQPRLTRAGMLPPTPGGQPDLSVRSTRAEPDLVSENLARIFVRQGKTARAIEIYEKLMVKQPEKMAYFALQIQSLQPSA